MRLIAFCGEIADPMVGSSPNTARAHASGLIRSSALHERSISILRFSGFQKTEKWIFGLDGGLKMVWVGASKDNLFASYRSILTTRQGGRNGILYHRRATLCMARRLRVPLL